MNDIKMFREQLDTSLQKFKILQDGKSSEKGWIKVIRKALGMSARQLAGKLGITQQAVSRMEKDELSGSVTIKKMRRIAGIVDCKFVYGFIPNSTLDETLRKQIEKKARIYIGQSNHKLFLDDPGLTSDANKKILDDIIDALLDEMPSNLWEE